METRRITATSRELERPFEKSRQVEIHRETFKRVRVVAREEVLKANEGGGWAHRYRRTPVAVAIEST